jgi:hypothetical protein
MGYSSAVKMRWLNGPKPEGGGLYKNTPNKYGKNVDLSEAVQKKP